MWEVNSFSFIPAQQQSNEMNINEVMRMLYIDALQIFSFSNGSFSELKLHRFMSMSASES